MHHLHGYGWKPSRKVCLGVVKERINDIVVMNLPLVVTTTALGSSSVGFCQSTNVESKDRRLGFPRKQHVAGKHRSDAGRHRIDEEIGGDAQISDGEQRFSYGVQGAIGVRLNNHRYSDRCILGGYSIRVVTGFLIQSVAFQNAGTMTMGSNHRYSDRCILGGYSIRVVTGFLIQSVAFQNAGTMTMGSGTLFQIPQRINYPFGTVFIASIRRIGMGGGGFFRQLFGFHDVQDIDNTLYAFV
eukprot:CAMPEP_0194445626 /NCGR_PEP_ID=MMETSP0176-20130528/127973_1 /TAXON_ID=216777 /ORGANISM="Proboscia alata, Strain PI-D3" /LENGTH=241 /DNA_ID=CAMNT_0039272219 /DNA_START=173 /DNA_END=898 /DNA_ORIENTATION=+